MNKKIELYKPVKEKPCDKKVSFHTVLCRNCKSTNFFLGATRTYNYIAGLPISNSWHYQNPTYGQIVLSKQTADGGRPQSSFNATPYYTVYGSPSRVDQGCLAYYARYNAVLYGTVITPPDQTKLGRYGKLMQDYYHFVETKLINDFNQRQVKWINGYMFKYLLTPISLSFWIGGCGLPCWECSYSGILCEGGPEGTLLGIILGLDRYWITQKADNQRLWPNTEYYLVDYYGVTIRGPEPKIGWLFYIMFKKEVCSYCHCVLFCFQVQCADPWKVWYQVSTSIITYETGPYGSESIPHRKADKFIEFYNKSKIDISKHKIELDNVANDEVFIRGTMDYHTATISPDKPAIYTVSKQIYALNKTKDAEVYGGGFGEEWNVKTRSSGFKEGGSGIANFFIYGISGQQAEIGNGFCNVATKYHTWHTRTGQQLSCPGITGAVFRQPWLYTDIPDRVPMHCTPTITSFDIGDVPSTYFDDVGDPLRTMYKNVYYQTMTKTDPSDLDLMLNGNGAVRMPYGSYGELQGGKTLKQKFYPFVWCDRVIFKIINAPYNLYIKSGETEFTECALGETLTNLTPGRYYFPNPYSNLISQTSVSAGKDGQHKNPVYDEENFKKYFETNLPHQFITGNDITMRSRYQYAIQQLGDPTQSLPLSIEHFPRMKITKVGDLEIKDWTKSQSYDDKVVSAEVIPVLEANKTEFNASLPEGWKPVFDTI